MKYNTKSLKFSGDEPNINNISSSSSVDEKRLLLKKSSYINQNRKKKRIEKNACEMMNLGSFKEKYEQGPLRPQWPPFGHVIPGLLSGFDPDGKDITKPESLMIVNDPNLHSSLEESSATSVALWGGWDQFRSNSKTPNPTIVEYVKRYPTNTVTRTLGGHTYKIKVKQMFDAQYNRVLGFTIITGKWKGFDGKHWGFIKWFDGSWQCQVSETYAFRLGNADITNEYLSQLPRELMPGLAMQQTNTVITATPTVINNNPNAVVSANSVTANPTVINNNPNAVVSANSVTANPTVVNNNPNAVVSANSVTANPTVVNNNPNAVVSANNVTGLFRPCPKFADEMEFLNMYSPVDRDFFVTGGRVPGILSGYNRDGGNGISVKGFPNSHYFKSSVSMSAKQWEGGVSSGMTKKQFIKQNPIIGTWSPSLEEGGENFNIKLAQMYSPKPEYVEAGAVPGQGAGEPDILGFKVMAGIPKDEPNQEYGFIQWYKDSFDCAVSDVYKFKIGYDDTSDMYLSMLPGAYRGKNETLEADDEYESYESDEEDEDMPAGGAGVASASASSGMGSSSSCPKHCTDPHSDGWWKNTEQLLWENSVHKEEVARKLKEKMYPSASLNEIIDIITHTYDIDRAEYSLDKNRLKERRLEDAAIHCVRNAYIELSREINGKLKLSSKKIVREVWLRKLMKYITNEYMMHHYEPALKQGEEDLESVLSELTLRPNVTKKQVVDAVLKLTIDKAEAIFGLLSDHLYELNLIWKTADYGSEPLYVVGILEPFVKSALNKYKSSMLKRYGVDDESLAMAEGVGKAAPGLSDNEISSSGSGPFGGMTFKEEEMLFFKRSAKKIMVAIIKDTPFPTEVLDEFKEREGVPELEQEFNSDVNRALKQVAGDNAPVIDINTSKMSELFYAYSTVHRDNHTQLQDRMNQVMTYLAIHMAGEEEWIVEQFKELQKSRYKDTKVVKFAVQLIKKLGNTIETEQKIEQKIELDVEQVEKIGEAINETETPPEDLEKDLEVAREEVRQECENASDRLTAQIEELRDDLQKEKDKIKGKDDMIKYGAIGAGVVIVLLILFLLIK